MITLPDRWYDLRPHKGQHQVWTALDSGSPVRFLCVECGRRSGKTEVAVKRLGVKRAMEGGLNVVLGEPTHQQAKRVLWQDVKALVPPELCLKIYEGETRIALRNGSMIYVGGMDAPQRFEGIEIDHLALDEAADCKEEVYEHLSPALSTAGRPPGTAVFAGTPDNVSGAWFAKLCDQARRNDMHDWLYASWTSEGIIDPAELERQRRSLPPDIFEQEFMAKRVTASGRVYYAFDPARHVYPELPYNKRAPLIITLDFNVDPGVCVVIQEHENRDADGGRLWGDESYARDMTCVIDEIYIPKASNTARVMRTFLEKYPDHEGDILLDGDPAGGARSTKHEHVGGDWQIALNVLETVYSSQRIFPMWSRKAPSIRSSVGAVNARFQSASHEIALIVDAECEHMIRDLNYTRLVKGSHYDIDKNHDRDLTHLSDALRYYIAREFPMVEGLVTEHGWR